MAKPICSVGDCERPVYGRGLCNRCYQRLRRTGTTAQGQVHTLPGEGRRWVEANYDADPDGPCVLWPYSTVAGYGRRFKVGDRRLGAHVYATELREGPCPPGMQACHGPCHAPLCIIHVTWGTPAQNAADKVRDGTDARGEKQGAAKLTAADVREIRRLIATEALMGTEIAARYNVSPSTISVIKLRKWWAWLE